MLFCKEHICYRKTAWAVSFILNFVTVTETGYRDYILDAFRGTIRGYHYFWFSSEVTKIQTSKWQELLRFYFHLAEKKLLCKFST